MDKENEKRSPDRHHHRSRKRKHERDHGESSTLRKLKRILKEVRNLDASPVSEGRAGHHRARSREANSHSRVRTRSKTPVERRVQHRSRRTRSKTPDERRARHRSRRTHNDKDNGEQHLRGLSHCSRGSGRHSTSRDRKRRENSKSQSGSDDGEQSPRGHRIPDEDSTRVEVGDAITSVNPDPDPGTSLVTGVTMSEDNQITEVANEIILNLLGGDPIKEDAKGPSLFIAVAEMWSKILGSGLSKEVKQELINKYPAPENCPLLKAPLLNPEVKSAMNGIAIKKDQFQTYTQGQLAAGIAALGSCLSEMVKQERSLGTEKSMAELITLLSDAGKIFTDLHHDISMTRRHFIIPGLNPPIKSIADGGTVDTLLFGVGLAEKLRSAKAVEQSGKDLAKPAPSLGTKKGQPPSYKGPPSGKFKQSSGQQNLNSKGLSRRSYPMSQQERPKPRYHHKQSKTQHRK